MKVLHAWIAFAGLAALTVTVLIVALQYLSCTGRGGFCPLDFLVPLALGLGCLTIAALIWALIASVLAVMSRHDLSTEQVDRARKLTEEGHTIGEAAAMLDIPRDDLYRALSSQR